MTTIPLVLWCCWFGGRKGIRPVKNERVRFWYGFLPGVRCKRFAYSPADATAIPSSLAPVKSRMVYLTGARLARLSGKKAVKTEKTSMLGKKTANLTNFLQHTVLLLGALKIWGKTHPRVKTITLEPLMQIPKCKLIFQNFEKGAPWLTCPCQIWPPFVQRVTPLGRKTSNLPLE